MQLPAEDVVRDYKNAKRRLLVLGYNSTLTTAVEAPRQPKNHYDQIKVAPWLCQLAVRHKPCTRFLLLYTINRRVCKSAQLPIAQTP